MSASGALGVETKGSAEFEKSRGAEGAATIADMNRRWLRSTEKDWRLLTSVRCEPNTTLQRLKSLLTFFGFLDPRNQPVVVLHILNSNANLIISDNHLLPRHISHLSFNMPYNGREAKPWPCGPVQLPPPNTIRLDRLCELQKM